MIMTKIVLAACALSAAAASVNQLWDQVSPDIVSAATQQAPMPQQVPPPAIDMGQMARAFRH